MRYGNQVCVAVLAVLLAAGCAEPVQTEFRWQAFGGEASALVWSTSDRVAQEIYDEMQEATARAEAAADLSRVDSELSRLNSQAAEMPFRVEERDLYVCIKRALEYARVSGGAFDPTLGPVIRLYREAAEQGRVPPDVAIEEALAQVAWADVVMLPEAHAVRFRREGMQIDLGPMADGLALDLAVRAFSRVGSRAGLLRLRGSIQAWGEPPGREAWDVPLFDPRSSDVELGTLSVDNRAVGIATPAFAEPGDLGLLGRMVLDPRTGKPSTSNVLVAVAVAEGAADASALAQSLAAGGTLGAGAMLSKTRRVEAVLLVDGDGEPYVLASASLRDRLQLSASLLEEVRGSVRYILPPQSIDVDLGI